jgi:hypothetical protein
MIKVTVRNYRRDKAEVTFYEIDADNMTIESGKDVVETAILILWKGEECVGLFNNWDNAIYVKGDSQ